MLGLAWFTAGAVLGFKGSKHTSYTFTSTKVYTNAELENQVPIEGLSRTSQAALPNGGKRVVTQTIEHDIDGIKATERRVETGRKTPLGTRLIVAGIVGVMALIPHSCATIVAPYRDLDNSLDQYGLQQIWSGFTFNK